jgi:catechol 2,3-dioxygenase-like lactoylglutathione lyase family enzyme
MRIDHFGMTVSSIETSEKFYAFFGFQPVYKKPELLDADWISEMTSFPGTRLKVQLLKSTESDAFIELLEYVNPRGENLAGMPTSSVGSAHLCFIVTDVEAECAKLVAAGVSLRSGIITVPSGYTAAGVKSIYGSDPDGYTFELVQKPE